jgi:hypothetical protein
VEIGHKGKYVGVVGIFRNTNQELELKYEMVLMDPIYQPKEGEKNAIVDVLQEYANEVMRDNLLVKASAFRSPHPIQIDAEVQQKFGGSYFVGSKACKDCHEREYDIWEKSRHSHAFATLVNKAKNPSLRQFDPECVVCHTVGFKYPEGYNELPRAAIRDLVADSAPPAEFKKKLAAHNENLEHVGCESCHGPGSAHIDKTKNKRLHELMNPYRPSEEEKRLVGLIDAAPNDAAKKKAREDAKILFDRRMERIDQFCGKCHDLENDVNWTKVPFLTKWVGGGIMHNKQSNVGNRWLPRAAGQPTSTKGH